MLSKRLFARLFSRVSKVAGYWWARGLMVGLRGTSDNNVSQEFALPTFTGIEPLRLRNLILVKLGLSRKTLVLVGTTFVLSATTLSSDLMAIVSHVPSVYSFLFLLIVLCLILPLRFMFISPLICILFLSLLGLANNYKISQIEIPITYFDIKMTLQDPQTVMNALGIYRHAWLIDASRAIAVIIVIAMGWIAHRYARRAPRAGVRVAGVTAAIVFIGFLGRYSVINYTTYVRDSMPAKSIQSWDQVLNDQVILSRKLGVVEYIVLSMLTERVRPDSPQAYGPRGPSGREINEAASSFVSIPLKTRKLLPNIVIMHAESTFDPNRAFKLSDRIELPIWSGTYQTRAIGPLRVSVVGGGSWVTDFEVLTGINPHLFGFQGYYTNYFVAPLVKHSFVQYLSKKGYTTAAFYAASGWAFNTQYAFKYYGFDDFIDGPRLGMPRDWRELRDKDFAKAVDNFGAFEISNQPFLYFIEAAQNHSPHPCEHFNSAMEFSVTYRSDPDFDLNCQLNEYLRRAKSTSDAFLYLLERLEDIEAETKRPFVLLAYGDHQPSTFMGNGRVRTTADEHETIFHVVASEASIIRNSLSVTPPASFLPTLLSAFVASSYDDLYLPQNFYLVKNCGWDFGAPSCLAYPSIASALQASLIAGH